MRPVRRAAAQRKLAAAALLRAAGRIELAVAAIRRAAERRRHRLYWHSDSDRQSRDAIAPAVRWRPSLAPWHRTAVREAWPTRRRDAPAELEPRAAKSRARAALARIGPRRCGLVPN